MQRAEETFLEWLRRLRRGLMPFPPPAPADYPPREVPFRPRPSVVAQPTAATTRLPQPEYYPGEAPLQEPSGFQRFLAQQATKPGARALGAGLGFLGGEMEKIMKPLERVAEIPWRLSGYDEEAIEALKESGQLWEPLFFAAPPGAIATGGLPAAARELKALEQLGTKVKRAVPPAVTSYVQRAAKGAEFVVPVKQAVKKARVKLEPELQSARITRFLDPVLESRRKATEAAVKAKGLEFDALAGTRPDEYFLAVERPMPKERILQAYERDSRAAFDRWGVQQSAARQWVEGKLKTKPSGLPSKETLYFKSFDDAEKFLTTGEFSPPSITSPLRTGPVAPLYVTAKATSPLEALRPVQPGAATSPFPLERPRGVVQPARRAQVAAGQAELPVAEAAVTRASLLQEASQFKSPEEFIASIQKELGVRDSLGNKIPMSKAVATPQGEAKLAAIEAQPVSNSGGGWFYKAKDIWEEAKLVAKAPSAAVPARGRAPKAVVPGAAQAAGVTEGVQLPAAGAIPPPAARPMGPSGVTSPAAPLTRDQLIEQEIAAVRAKMRGEAVPAAPPSVPPIKPPAPPEALPPADPLAPRPRTLVDMNREAKGMRAMTPEQRAAVMDLAEPIKGDILYQARPFNEHARNLLGPDTGFMKALRRVPGLKQVFGAWNPAAMARDNPVAMIGLRQSIFQEIEKARVRFVTLRWWHDADAAFAFKRSGTAYGLKPTSGVWKATNIKPATAATPKGKMFGTINDIIEHPERYKLNDAQKKALALADNTLTQSVRDAQRVGVDVVELAEAYWPRSVIRGPKGEKGFAGIRRRVSGAKGYTHQRAFADVDDLVKAGFDVETDPRRVFASRLEAGIDTIAQANARKQIAALPGVEKPLERMARRFPAVLESAKQARIARDAAKVTVVKAGAKASPEQIMALRQAEADYITSMREVFAKKIETGTPGYYELRLPSGRIAPQELVEQVGKFIDLPELRQGATGGAARLTQEISQLLRTSLTNVDIAAGYIQGQALFYRNNIAWWKAQGHSIVSLIDDPTAFVARNFEVIDEGVRMGAIVAPTEFLFAKQGIASIPLRIPYVGPALGSFNRAFEWFITAGQTELFKAARSGVAKNAGIDELVSLGSAIRKQVGTESYAILGVRVNQKTMEALSLFAARFFRATVGILGQSFTRGPGGAEARKAVGSLIAGGTALTIGITWAQNKKLPNMTDPYAPDWMQFKIGKTYFNTFGPFYPYFRTMARMSVSLAELEPLKAATELKRFLSSKESLPLRAIDIAGQLIYYGSANVYGTKIEKQWLSIVKGLLSEFVTPISLQEIPTAIMEGRPEQVAEFAGLIGRPERLASEWYKVLEAYRDIPSNEEERKDKLAKAKTPEERARYQQSRDTYRTKNPETDAVLFITGTGGVDTVKTTKALNIAARLMVELGLEVKDIKSLEEKKYEPSTKAEWRWNLQLAIDEVRKSPAAPPVSGQPQRNVMQQSVRKQGMTEEEQWNRAVLERLEPELAERR